MHLAGAEDGVAAPLLPRRGEHGPARTSTVMEEAMAAQRPPQPTMPAMVSSFMQFCSETT